MPRESTGRLFEEPEEEQTPITETQDGSAAAPLAERMRPRTLEEFVGQAGLVGKESVLGRALRPEGRLPSLILWGPPGPG
jgi:putative ATPase